MITEAANVSPAQALDRALRDASPAEVIETALKTVGRENLALVSSFGTESAALLKVMADVDPAIPVVFLDTGWKRSKKEPRNTPVKRPSIVPRVPVKKRTTVSRTSTAI